MIKGWRKEFDFGFEKERIMKGVLLLSICSLTLSKSLHLMHSFLLQPTIQTQNIFAGLVKPVQFYSRIYLILSNKYFTGTDKSK